MFLSFIEVIAGLICLVFGADRFVTGAVQISRVIGVSPLIIGLTIVGMATSAPEILVGVVAALDNKTNIAVGNAIGSNIANIGLVLGGAIIFRPFITTAKKLGREYLAMMCAAFIGLAVMVDSYLGQSDGVILLFCLICFLAWSIHIAKTTEAPSFKNGSTTPYPLASDNIAKPTVLFCVGLAILFVGAELLVRGSTSVAKMFGLSDLVIGLTIVAVGTSLPELAASIMSIVKKEPDIAIGNIIGSNIFNMLAVLSIPVLIHPANFELDLLTRDFSIMLGLSLFLGWIIFIYKKYDRLHGFILLSIFLSYQCWLLIRVTGT